MYKLTELITRRSKLIFIINIILLIICVIISSLFCLTIKSNKQENPYDIKVKNNDNFVFLGDSITDWYPIKELYDDLPIINSGVAGYTTDDILENLDDMVTIYNPTKVFILIGTNDIEKDKSEEEISKNIKKIVDNILKKRPNTKIYIESIYPINNTDDEKINHDMVGKRDNKKIRNINKKIKKYCESKNYTYINMYDELLDKDGNLDLKYTEEGLHLTDLGYLKVTKVLYRYLND